MLCLTRSVNERIHIGDDIVIRVKSIGAERVKLAIEAPRGVRIRRGELSAGAERREYVKREQE